MRSMFSPAAWTRRSAAHPRRVIGAWALAFVAAVAVVALLLGDALSAEQAFVNTPESERAAQIIEQDIGARDAVTEQVIVRASAGTFDDAALRERVDGLAANLASLGPDVVTSATSPFATEASPLVSADRRTAIIPVVMAGDLNAASDTIEEVIDTARAQDGRDGLAVNVTGQASINFDSNKVAENDLKVGESFGILIALVILAIVFGALVAALLPVLLAIVSIVVALALTALVGQVTDLSFFVTNMITMMGLAVGIDYALFIVSRYREERAAGRERIDAIERSGATASRAVFFSGLTVIVALVGLLIVPLSVFVSLAVGAILVVFAAIIAAMTLLPAMLAVLGDRIDAGRLSRLVPKRLRRQRGEGAWARIVGAVMRRPAISLVLAAGLLIAAAIPYFGINTGAAGVSTLPPDLQSRVGFDTLQREFSVGNIAPARIPITGDPTSAANQDEIARITAAIVGDPVLGTPALEPGAGARGGVLSIPVNAEATSVAATDAVRRLREVTTLPVGGAAAENVDYFDLSDDYLPIVVGVVLVLSFLILLLAFRSIVVPLVAIAMNLLSVGAAFGLVTLVSQEGVGAGILGFQQVETVEAWVPLFLFAVLFGLSMDYHVFLLSRIRERFQQTGDNVASITHGISSSGRLITGAALIMVAVFGGFAAGDLVMFQQMGFGLGAAVLIDATIVRGVIVPAVMRLIGKWNWYLPKSLNWLPHFATEAEPARTQVAA